MRRYAFILALCVSAPLCAQQSDAPVLARRDSSTGGIVSWKDPAHARSLSWWLAGAGNMYTGDQGTGLVYAMLDVGAVAVAIGGYWRGTHCDMYNCNGHEMGLAASGAVVSLVLSALSASEAEGSAKAFNTRYRLGATIRSVRPVYVAGANGGGVGLGFSLR